MGLSASDLSRLLLALIVLLSAAHIGAHLFRMLRQPPVIGEIVGGLVLGPSVAGVLWSGVDSRLFSGNTGTRQILGSFYELGLLLLVYLTGSQLAGRPANSKRRTITTVGAVGLVLPFIAGLVLAARIDTSSLSGTAGTRGALALVIGMAVAVTSIPVISRIMDDLGILGSIFARVVLTIAVFEDILLYVVLTVILGLAGAHSGSGYGLARTLSLNSPNEAAIYFTAAPCLFMAIFLWRGRELFARLQRSRFNVIESRSPVAFRLLSLLSLAMLCTALGIDPIFGALVAGLCVASRRPATLDAASEPADRAQSVIADIANAVFIPVYFAMVGLQLDLANHVDPWFLVWFIALACAIKFVSVWLGATLAGEPTSFALPLAVAMNARGGPGIVLASAVYSAKVVNQNFFTSLVLLSLITSYIAGVFLQWFTKQPGQDWLDGRPADVALAK